MSSSRWSFLQRFPVLAGAYIIITLALSLQKYSLGPDHYGNYLIFKNSFIHLIAGQDMYAHYPELKIDLYKYSPSFAVLFAPFSFLPDVLGLCLWNLLNALILLGALRWLISDDRQLAFISWFILIELITSLQNFQSNGLTAGLIVASLAGVQGNRQGAAAMAAVTGFFVKLFGILGSLFWLFSKQKVKYILFFIAGTVLLAGCPYVVASADEVQAAWKGWLQLLGNDPAHELNHSVMSVARSWFGLEFNKIYFQLGGLMILLLPLIYLDRWTDPSFRRYFLSSVLLFAVIFNHKAESPGFIIAVTGFAIWFFAEKRHTADQALAVLLFVLTCLSPTDIFPKVVRENWVVPYSLKAVPCILAWFRIQVDLHRGRKTGGGN